MSSRRFHPCDVWERVKPVTLMLLVEAFSAGVSLSYKLAMEKQLPVWIIISYRYMFATVFMAPLAFFIERKKWPKLTWTVLCQAFFCGLLGGPVAQDLHARSIAMTSATYAAAMANIIPALTFTMAVFLRMEKLHIRRPEGMAKVIGTIIGIVGAMVLTFYKGMQLHLWSTHVSNQHHASRESSNHTSTQWLVGSALALGSCISYSMYLIIQLKMAMRYPCHFSSTTLISAMGAVQATVIALCTNRDWGQWRLGWNTTLLIISYTGIVGSGINVALVAWCMHLRGPLFGSMFSPMALVFVALGSTLFMKENLHVGSLVGAAVIVVGLYMVLWGKGKEMEKLDDDKKTTTPSTSCLLADHIYGDENKDGNPESHTLDVRADGRG